MLILGVPYGSDNKWPTSTHSNMKEFHEHRAREKQVAKEYIRYDDIIYKVLKHAEQYYA